MPRALQTSLVDIAYLAVPVLWLGLLAGVSEAAGMAQGDARHHRESHGADCSRPHRANRGHLRNIGGQHRGAKQRCADNNPQIPQLENHELRLGKASSGRARVQGAKSEHDRQEAA